MQPLKALSQLNETVNKMGRPRKNTTVPGVRYGKLTTRELYGYKKGQELWICDCDCGKETVVAVSNLINGHTKSCGCIVNDGHSNYRHGLRQTRLYNIHTKIKQRCFNENDKNYYNYGKRGITICDEWCGKNGFINFYNWAMENGYDDDLSIDRIDVDGNYCPDNCRWTDMETQQNNRRNNRCIEYNGRIHTISEWAKIKNIPYERLRTRIKNGWSIEKALNMPKTY